MRGSAVGGKKQEKTTDSDDAGKNVVKDIDIVKDFFTCLTGRGQRPSKRTTRFWT